MHRRGHAMWKGGRHCAQWKRERALRFREEQEKKDLEKISRPTPPRHSIGDAPQSDPQRRRYECTECIAGRAKDWPHRRKQTMETLSVPELHLDYCLLRDMPGGGPQCCARGQGRRGQTLVGPRRPHEGATLRGCASSFCATCGRSGCTEM